MTTAKKKLKNPVVKTSDFINKILLAAYVVILLFTFFKVYNDVFDKKVNLGGDTASYYILGQAIASGEGFTNIHTKEKLSHNHFPPGYPLIIGAASKVISNDILFIKRLNGFFLFLSIVFLFLLLFKITSNYHIPFITSLFVLFNFHILSYSVIMMSEIPYLFFSTLVLWLLLKIDLKSPVHKNWMFFVLIVLIAFSYHIRSLGIALFAGIAGYLLITKNWKYFSTLVIGFIVLSLPWFIRNQSLGGNSYSKQLFLKNPYRPELGQMEFLDWFKRIWINLERYVAREIPGGTLNFIEITDPGSSENLLDWIIGVIVISIMVFGLLKLKRSVRIILFYIVTYFAILLLWPDVWYGVRFLLPLVPLLTFLLVNGLYELILVLDKRVFKLKNQLIIPLAFVALSLVAAKLYGDKSDQKLQRQSKATFNTSYQNYFKMANWIRENSSDTAVVCCRKGQLFYIYSNRYVTSYKNTLDIEEQIEYLISKQATYVVLDNLGYSSTQRYLFPAIKRYPNKFKEVLSLKDPDTYLLEFRPQYGYWGDWKDDKKDGYGIFKWENGKEYVGEWKNDKEHGKGTYKWKDGKQYSGEWNNGKRHGIGEFSWPNGNHFKGEWKNDKRNGKGAFTINTDVVLNGTWTDNVLNGLVDVTDLEGTLIEKRIYENNTSIKVIK